MRLASEILHAILKRIRAGEDRRMRGPGERNLRDGAVEDHVIRCEGIERGRFNVLRAVATEMIGTERINCNKNDIGAWRRRMRNSFGYGR